MAVAVGGRLSASVRWSSSRLRFSPCFAFRAVSPQPRLSDRVSKMERQRRPFQQTTSSLRPQKEGGRISAAQCSIHYEEGIAVVAMCSRRAVIARIHRPQPCAPPPAIGPWGLARSSSAGNSNRFQGVGTLGQARALVPSAESEDTVHVTYNIMDALC